MPRKFFSAKNDENCMVKIEFHFSYSRLVGLGTKTLFFTFHILYESLITVIFLLSSSSFIFLVSVSVGFFAKSLTVKEI